MPFIPVEITVKKMLGNYTFTYISSASVSPIPINIMTLNG